MTSRPAIEVQNLSKKYILGKSEEQYLTLRDAIKNLIFSPFQKTPYPSAIHELWALKNITFSIDSGEVVGIIGRNGAGKSTLLKILSRITLPSEGKVQLNGRVGSLLEVGTGFHPELTGRENILLSGSILGMRRNDIENKMDEIIKFSDIEKFLDTPVKRYSSGMYVRLAFAVAAHLDPEILLVDEVLAVGDFAFQKKCLGKMSDISKEGRTVLFVSHNMKAIEQLCNYCIFLEEGHIKSCGSEVKRIINEYLFPDLNEISPSYWSNKGDELHNSYFQPINIALVDNNGIPLKNPVSNDKDIWIQIEGLVEIIDPALEIGYLLSNEDGIKVYVSYFNDHDPIHWPNIKYGMNILKTKIPKRFLNEGLYKIELCISLRCRMWIAEPGKNSPSINLIISGGLSDSPYWREKREGLIAPLLEWEKIN